MTGEAVFKAQKVYGQLYADMELPVGNQFAALPWSYNPRALVLLFGIPTVARHGQNRDGRRIFDRLVEVSAANGWAEYRTHVGVHGQGRGRVFLQQSCSCAGSTRR